MKIAAVIAHYDVENGISNNFREILAIFCEICSHVVLVSTSNIENIDLNDYENLTIINRPNIGYDFYSYRVGFNALVKIDEIDRLFIVNSSFILLNKKKFKDALRDMLARSANSVVGITSSRQISLHLQSYLLLIYKNVIYSHWFLNFINSVQPENTKFNVIAKYEVGLSAELIRHGVNLTSIFNPTNFQKIASSYLYAKYLIKKLGFLNFLIGSPFKHVREVNWAHYGAKDIAHRFGFIKTEVVRNNPFGINLKHIKQLENEFIYVPQSRYLQQSDGLYQLYHRDILISRVSYGVSKDSHSRVAVVLHLYYIDLLAEIVEHLHKNLIDPFDIFITTPFEGEIPKIIDTFSKVAVSINVFLTKNIGRDIGPFLEIYKTGLLDRYPSVLKIHSKKSLYSANGDYWRKDIYKQLIGESYRTRKIINHLEDGKVGVVGAGKYYLSDIKYWGADKNNVKKILTTLGVLSNMDEPTLGFFAGSMFWFNPKAFFPLKQLQLEFEPENGAQDGTMAHAVERIFCQIARYSGFIVSAQERLDQDLDCFDLSNNWVPVL